MEEPKEVHNDDKIASSEKKHNRIYKTPAQLAALEKFYNAHQYPTEAMKVEFAESTGLTEKQVSGWFCHRRLKDKRLQNGEVQKHGKQDRSSGVIQDRNSGQKQDSCSSTKKGDNKQFDPKEVESRMYTSEGLLPKEFRYEHECQYNTIMEMDNDTSSESSSPLMDHMNLQNVDRIGMVTSKFPNHNDVISVTGRTGPSGYLKVKGQAENVAITAVKRQLGRLYREDGPPLSIEFDPLPPGAFENPTEVPVPVNQSHYSGDRAALHPMDGSRTFQLPNASKMYRRYSTCYDPIDMDESGLNTRHASNHHEKYYNNNDEYNQKPHFSKHRHSLSGRSYQMELNDDSGDEASIHDLREQFEPRMKHGPGVRRSDIGPCKVNYIDRIEPLTSDLTFTQGEFEDRRLSRKTSKDDRFNGQSRGIDGRHRNEMTVTKRIRDEFMHKVNRRHEKVVDVHPITNKTLLDLANCADDRSF